MDQYVDAIQARMRVLKYPDFRSDNRREVQINLAAPELDLQQNQLPRWHFTNFSKTAGFILLPNALFYQNTDYETSAELRQALLQGVQVIHEVVGLDYVESISVRTLDAVVPDPGQNFQDYIKPQFLGFCDVDRHNLQRSISESILKRDDITTIARIVFFGSEANSLGIPFDLFPISLKLLGKFEGVTGPHVILDNDSRRLGRFEFNEDEISSRLVSVKNEVDKYFHHVSTDWAIKLWKGE